MCKEKMTEKVGPGQAPGHETARRERRQTAGKPAEPCAGPSASTQADDTTEPTHPKPAEGSPEQHQPHRQ